MKFLGSTPLIGKVFLILAILAAVIAVGLYRINANHMAMEAELTQIIEYDEEGGIWLARSRAAVNAVGRLAVEAVFEPSGFKARQIISRLKDQETAFLERLLQAEKLLRDVGEDIAVIRQNYERVSVRLETLKSAKLEQSDGGVSDALRDQTRAAILAIEEFDELLKNQIDRISQRTQIRARTMTQEARAENQQAIALAVAGLSCSFLFAFFLLRRTVVQPLHALTDTAKALLAGRLDQSIVGAERSDEIGDIARVCQQLKDSLTAINELSGRSTSAAQQVAAATSQATAAVEQVSSGSQRQMQSVETITASVSRTTSIIGTIASVSLSAKDRSREATTRLAEGLRQIEAMTTAVREIAITSQRINRITQSIGELATRSNILSLNAAIEAARAGDHGRGFSVVAEEVGNLAQQTANLAQEIALLASDSSERIQNGVTTATEVGGVMQSVAAAINETDSLSEDIAQSMDEQGKVLRQIEQSLQRLTEISNANAAASEEIAATMVELSRLTDAMRQEAQRARLGGAAHS